MESNAIPGDCQAGSTDDPTVHRFFTGFGRSEYAGAVMGFVSVLAERRDVPDLTLSPATLADRFGTSRHTIRKTLQRLVRSGVLTKSGRNTYRLTPAGRKRLENERPQFYLPDRLKIDGMTPKLACVHYVADNAKKQAAAASWFGVDETTWRRLRRRADVAMNPKAGTERPVRSGTERPVKRDRTPGQAGQNAR